MPNIESGNPEGRGVCTVVENLKDSLACIDACCGRLVQELEDAIAEASTLAATPHWEGASLYVRAGKYAYLHEWKPGGRRIRKYVGRDPRKVRKAELLVARGILMARARVRILRLEAECEQLSDMLRRAVHLFDAVTDLESRLALGVGAEER